MFFEYLHFFGVNVCVCVCVCVCMCVCVRPDLEATLSTEEMIEKRFVLL